jgi:hypothetical protein
MQTAKYINSTTFGKFFSQHDNEIRSKAEEKAFESLKCIKPEQIASSVYSLTTDALMSAIKESVEKTNDHNLSLRERASLWDDIITCELSLIPKKNKDRICCHLGIAKIESQKEVKLENDIAWKYTFFQAIIENIFVIDNFLCFDAAPPGVLDPELIFFSSFLKSISDVKNLSLELSKAEKDEVRKLILKNEENPESIKLKKFLKKFSKVFNEFKNYIKENDANQRDRWTTEDGKDFLPKELAEGLPEHISLSSMRKIYDGFKKELIATTFPTEEEYNATLKIPYNEAKKEWESLNILSQ